MDGNFISEVEILEKKRKQIRDEIEEKTSNQDSIKKKMMDLAKEARGSYSQEKETTEKIFNLLLKDKEKYEEAFKNPYFGRVDFREYRRELETLYIGKKGINSTKDGEEIVIDWRAPVADLYYSGTGGDAHYKSPKGVIEGELELKRKFLFKDGDLKEIFDDKINEIIINSEEGIELIDDLLKINLEESRGKKLKEVVSTIQKDQNRIIRWSKNLPLIVQGSAGSGKTTIALHRLAYILYRYGDTIKGKDILVLAPNKIFLDYISDILPDLGVEEVNQTTFSEFIIKNLKIKGKLYSKDKKLKDIIEEKNEEITKDIMDISKIKGSIFFKTIINRYIAFLESSSLDVSDIKIMDYILFNKREITRLYLKDLKTHPINKRKDEIKRYLNLKLSERIENLVIKVDNEWEPKIKEIKTMDLEPEERRQRLIKVYDERDFIKNSIKSNSKKVMTEYFKQWRGIKAKDIYLNFYKDEDIFDIVTDNIIPQEVGHKLKAYSIENIENGIVDEDDLAALMYIHLLLEGVEENSKFKHIVVDEAQDYSPFQIYIINELAKANSVTLVGDLAQGIYFYKGTSNWDEVIKEVFASNATYLQLSQSYRSTIEIIDFAMGALESQNLGIKSAKPVLRHGNKPEIIKYKDKNDIISKINEIVDYTIGKDKSSIAIITKSIKEAKNLDKILKNKTKEKFSVIAENEKNSGSSFVIIPSYLTKGLEFDTTIIFEPNINLYTDSALDSRLLYVVLTRALHDEFVLCKDEVTSMIK